MSTQQLTNAVMSLPISERACLAQTLWQSIEGECVELSEAALIQDVLRRDEELASGAVTGRCHHEVMKAAREAIACV